MSHFHAVVLVNPLLDDEEQIKTEVARLLAPFNENTEVPEYKSFMDEDEIKRMRDWYQKEGKIAPEDESLESLVELMKDWYSCEGGIEAGHLYCFRTYNPMSKWDWYEIGGRWDGEVTGNTECILCEKDSLHLYHVVHEQLTNNMVRVRSLPEDFSCWTILNEHGWHEKGKMGWFGMSSNDLEDWPDIIKKIFEEHQDYWAVTVDCHI